MLTVNPYKNISGHTGQAKVVPDRILLVNIFYYSLSNSCAGLKYLLCYCVVWVLIDTIFSMLFPHVYGETYSSAKSFSY